MPNLVANLNYLHKRSGGYTWWQKSFDGLTFTTAIAEQEVLSLNLIWAKCI